MQTSSEKHNAVTELCRAATNLRPAGEGLWVAGNAADVSYPHEGNRSSFQVEDDSFWHVHRSRCITDAVCAFPPAGPVLDVGGGNGFVTRALNRASFEAVLVEPGIAGIDNARRRGIRPLVHATLENAGFPERSIPAVGIFDVLEHVEHDGQFLTNVRRLLCRGGMLYVTVPAHRFLWSVEDEYAGHYRRYTLGQLRRSLHASGFRVLFASYFFSILPVPIFAFRTLPRLFGLRRDFDAGRCRREHSLPVGPVARTVRRVLAAERRWLSRRRTIPVGGSCLAVATSGPV